MNRAARNCSELQSWTVPPYKCGQVGHDSCGQGTVQVPAGSADMQKGRGAHSTSKPLYFQIPPHQKRAAQKQTAHQSRTGLRRSTALIHSHQISPHQKPATMVIPHLHPGCSIYR
eukprot:Protomagalhaensia_wolfi_Nauph_80__2968@NODE_3043_length_910_cov_6420_609644_g2384_i0_p1_GENE_NODE_3043_length_910_cov_6420_609644_g2384_i0NODE_3043_length_910_cov_6420_609644_g2384_i0_p1_ORF_typecomplete_len115_score3_67zfCCHC/PF00098_23/9_6e02zfCCHC/PF00098_23/0_12zfCCHC/PF00098_23/6e03_NODE_3043_length_910_cov_6420_609644_g2384_i0198542